MSRKLLFAGTGPVVFFVGAVWLAGLTFTARSADGIYDIGAGSRAMSMGGAAVASPEGPLASLASNPAGLALLAQPEMEAGGLAAIPYGRLTLKTGKSGSLGSQFEAAPEGALAFPIHATPFTVAAGLLPEAGLSAHWHYTDPSGGLGGLASYGSQRDNSEITVLRLAFGASLALTRQLSLGGSLGLNYNENRLQTPYIFQSQPTLRGFKTLLDLSTSGWGANGTAGLLYRPIDSVAIGLSYTSRTLVDTSGDAYGNASAQLNALGPGYKSVRRDFHYNAEVENTFPQSVTGGIAWKFRPGWEVSTAVDWVNWSGAFNSLPIKLTNGNNADLNGLVGGNHLQDNTPLRWRDTFAYRIGLEHAITPSLLLRCGYTYSRSPVPDSTLTPLTAAIPEHSITAGAGYRWRWLQVDVAYQWDLPATRQTGRSGLLDGEYSDSSTRVGVQWLSLTTSIKF